MNGIISNVFQYPKSLIVLVLLLLILGILVILRSPIGIFLKSKSLVLPMLGNTQVIQRKRWKDVCRILLYPPMTRQKHVVFP
jgi:hypothetical protein